MTTTAHNPKPWYLVEGNLDLAEAEGINNARGAARQLLEEGNTKVEIYPDDGEHARPVETATICPRTGNAHFQGYYSREALR